MEQIYVVVEDVAGEGIDTCVFKSKEEAKEHYKNIVERHISDLNELGSGEINEYRAEITNEFDEEVARVFWQANILK